MVNETILSSPVCGGPVVLHTSHGGTSYYMPVSEEAFQKMMDVRQTDEFIRDRLLRAERIITQLRRELSECRDKNRAEVEGS